ncbi:MAG: hypothetical protein AAGG53_16795 [Cyanobacteria bacterium P01_H01_bin.152]
MAALQRYLKVSEQAGAIAQVTTDGLRGHKVLVSEFTQVGAALVAALVIEGAATMAEQKDTGRVLGDRRQSVAGEEGLGGWGGELGDHG